MTIIALTGMPAAGKGEVASVARERGWAVHRIGDLVWEETERRGLELAPASVGAFANGEREAHGYGVWASRSLERIDCAIYTSPSPRDLPTTRIPSPA